MTWTRVAPHSGPVHHGCLTCSRTDEIADLRMTVAVGFGSASVSRDGEQIWFETGDEDQELYNLAHFEALAAADPDHDWQVCLHGPLRGMTYQRHDVGKWVLIDSNEGFA